MSEEQVQNAALAAEDENHIIAERRAKLLRLREKGVAYPNDFHREDLFGDLRAKYGEMTAEELENSCRTYIALQVKDRRRAKELLACKYSRVKEDEAGYIRVYDLTTSEEIVVYLHDNGITVSELKTDKIGLEEYYIDLMKEGK